MPKIIQILTYNAFVNENTAYESANRGAQNPIFLK